MIGCSSTPLPAPPRRLGGMPCPAADVAPLPPAGRGAPDPPRGGEPSCAATI